MSLSGYTLNNFPMKSEEDYIIDKKIKESKPKTIYNKKKKICFISNDYIFYCYSYNIINIYTYYQG